MQPRGQLWFALQRVCQDFCDFSGLERKEAMQVLVTVLRNLLADQEQELEMLGQAPADPSLPEGPSPA